MDVTGMDKMQLMLGAATVVFAAGAVLVAVTHRGGPALRWVTAKASALADAIDRGVERVFGSGAAVFGDDIDWDAVAAGGARGQCPECFGQPGASLRAENAILRANASAGRAELQTLRHKTALMSDALTAADRMAATTANAINELEREIETLRRERSMRPMSRAVTTAASDLAVEIRPRRAPKLRAVPGAAMGDA